MRRAAYMMVLALMAPAGAWAQTAGPIDRVLTHREELSLTNEQVKKLEAIDQKFDQKNKDLVAKIEALRGRDVGIPMRVRDMAAEDREKFMANRVQLRPLMQELHTSHAAAISEMQGVLTQDQNSRAKAYMYQGAGQGQRAGRGAMQGRGGRGMMDGRRGAGRMRGT